MFKGFKDWISVINNNKQQDYHFTSNLYDSCNV
jgi:hypothetical protein